MEEIISKSVQIQGSTIHYFEHKEGGGKPHLLLISGWPSSVLILTPLMQKLSTRYHCIAVELPGYGRSESLSGINHTLDTFTNTMHDFYKIVLSDSIIEIFGYSLGGALALDFAAEFPEVVDRVIVYSTPYNGVAHTEKSQEEDNPLEGVYRFLWEHPRLMKALNIRRIKYAFWSVIFKLVYKKRYPKVRGLSKSFVKEVIRETSYVDLPRMFEYPLDYAGIDLSNKLKTLSVPLTVLSGEDDIAVLPQTSHELADLAPDGRLIVIPNADHASPYTDVSKIASAILNRQSKR